MDTKTETCSREILRLWTRHLGTPALGLTGQDSTTPGTRQVKNNHGLKSLSPSLPRCVGHQTLGIPKRSIAQVFILHSQDVGESCNGCPGQTQCGLLPRKTIDLPPLLGTALGEGEHWLISFGTGEQVLLILSLIFASFAFVGRER